MSCEFVNWNCITRMNTLWECETISSFVHRGKKITDLPFYISTKEYHLEKIKVRFVGQQKAIVVLSLDVTVPSVLSCDICCPGAYRNTKLYKRHINNNPKQRKLSQATILFPQLLTILSSCADNRLKENLLSDVRGNYGII